MVASLKVGEFVGSLDCGTTSARFIIFDRYANIIAQHQAEFPQYYPQPGWHEHDAEEIQQVCESCISKATENLESRGWSRDSVKVIGITNQRETAVAWSRKTGKPLHRAIVWTDSRTKNHVAHFEKKLREEGLCGKKGDAAVDKLREITGLQISTYFSGIKVKWMIDHDDAVREAHENDDLLFGTIESWIVYNLVGGVKKGLHITEVTNASRTLLLNMKTLQWDPALLDFFGIRKSVLPTIVSSSEVYGLIDVGPLKGVKIGGLIGDQQGALVGNKCLNQGEAKCTYGTGGFLLFCTGSGIVKSSHGLLGTIAYQPGPGMEPVYALEGSMAVAGSAIKWLRDSIKLIPSAEAVNDLAKAVNSSGGVYFVPAFSGLLAPYWDSGAAGLLIGLSSYTTACHIARATLEAIGFQTRAIINAMELDSGVSMKHLKVDGGVTNGDIAMEILADVGGFDVIRPEMRESTALGSALLAGSSIGLFGWDICKPETLAEVNTMGSTEFHPTSEASVGEKRWKGWQRAVQRSLAWEEGVDDDEEVEGKKAVITKVAEAVADADYSWVEAARSSGVFFSGACVLSLCVMYRAFRA
ncbi:glycerol kinase [Athelia psychrophila]|uniref:glycerol kinase n=1 Tax=Athelia psychrophila TaxID=1759441 RepID=A0A166JP19_9AGAM|nr:glycerol kinase [Fibularhizoctonia sp. CBS 109695]